MPKFQNDNIGERTIIKGKLDYDCLICKDKTNYIDYCCEVPVCSTECYDELTNQISSNNK